MKNKGNPNRRRKSLACDHDSYYLTYAKSNFIIRRALACRSCSTIILIPTYMAILSDLNSEKVQMGEGFVQ